MELVNALKFEVKKSFLLINRFNKNLQNDKIKENEKKIRQLQAALSDAHLKIVMLESTITVMEREEKREEDVIKKLGKI